MKRSHERPHGDHNFKKPRSQRPNWLPAKWDNEEAMRFYFEPLKQRELDEEEWQTKVDFWRPVFEASQLQSGCLTFTPVEMQERFRRGGSVPRCVPDILEHLYSIGDIKEVSSSGVIWKMLKFTYSYFLPVHKLSLTDRFYFSDHVSPLSERLRQSIVQRGHLIDFILTEVDIKAMLDRLQSEQPGLDIEKTKEKHPEDLNVLLAHLIQKKQARELIISESGHHIKVFQFSSTPRLKPLDGWEESAGRLKLTLTSIALGMETLERKIIEKTNQVREYLKQKQKEYAKRELVLVKLRKKRKDELHKIQLNIEQTLMRMQDMLDNKQISLCMQLGAKTLADLTKSVDLNALEDAMDEMKDSLAKQEDLESVLGQPLDEGSEEQVLEELKALTEKEEVETPGEEKKLKMPLDHKVEEPKAGRKVEEAKERKRVTVEMRHEPQRPLMVASAPDEENEPGLPSKTVKPLVPKKHPIGKRQREVLTVLT